MEEKTFVDDFREMMAGWNLIMAEAKRQFPEATEEELYQIASSAMRHALGMR